MKYYFVLSNQISDDYVIVNNVSQELNSGLRTMLYYLYFMMSSSLVMSALSADVTCNHYYLTVAILTVMESACLEYYIQLTQGS